MSSSKKCQLCLKEPHKYSCPRCNILYCSVNCYKSMKHLECSESFYKECIMEEMALQKPQQHPNLYSSKTLDDIPGLSSDIKRMYQMLKRMESCESSGSTISDFDITDIDEEDEDDDDEKTEVIDSDDDEIIETETDLEKRLKDVNLNDANAVWNKLTNKEKQEFENIIKSNDCTELMPIYKPWWEQKLFKNIEEIKDTTATDKNGTTTIAEIYQRNNELPKINESIIEFKKLTNKLPSECVPYNLMNLLGAYTIMLRYFNGDYLSQLNEACNYLISSCSNLKLNVNFQDQLMAIERIAYDLRNEGFTINSDNMQQIKDDLNAIINCTESYTNKSNVYTLAALSDIFNLLQLVRNNIKITKPKPTNNTSASSSLGLLGKGTDNKAVTINKLKYCSDDEFTKRFVDPQILNYNNFDKTKLASYIKKIEYYLAYVKEFQ